MYTDFFKYRIQISFACFYIFYRKPSGEKKSACAVRQNIYFKYIFSEHKPYLMHCCFSRIFFEGF